MALIRRGSAKKKYEARRAWLAARPSLYRNVPGISDDVSDIGRSALEGLRQVMAAENLFGGSPFQDQRDTLRRLVSELRGEHLGSDW